MGVRKGLAVCVIAIAVGIFFNYLHRQEMNPEGIEAKVTEKEDVSSEITEHEHSFVKTVWESATCQKRGYYNNVCSECGLVECVTEPMLDHVVENVVVQEGNCMEDTIIRHVCIYCGLQVKEDTRYTVTKAHDWVEESVDGKTVTCCVRCGITM